MPLVVADELVDPAYEFKHPGVTMNSWNFKSQVAKVIQEVQRKVAGAIKLMNGLNYRTW